jgi:hypothetical protein
MINNKEKRLNDRENMKKERITKLNGKKKPNEKKMRNNEISISSSNKWNCNRKTATWTTQYSRESHSSHILSS